MDSWTYCIRAHLPVYIGMCRRNTKTIEVIAPWWESLAHYPLPLPILINMAGILKWQVLVFLNQGKEDYKFDRI